MSILATTATATAAMHTQEPGEGLRAACEGREAEAERQKGNSMTLNVRSGGLQQQKMMMMGMASHLVCAYQCACGCLVHAHFSTHQVGYGHNSQR